MDANLFCSTTTEGEAVVCAAWIQGSLTVLAGLLALVGALWAGKRAYDSAVRQTKHQEDIYKARVDAYRFRLGVIASDLAFTATVNKHVAEAALSEYDGKPAPIYVPEFTIPAELRPDQWENHAMLGDAFVRVLHKCYAPMTEAERFGAEMRGRHTSDVSEHPTLKNGVEEPDGSISFSRDTAIEQNVKVWSGFSEAMNELAEFFAKDDAASRVSTAC